MGLLADVEIIRLWEATNEKLERIARALEMQYPDLPAELYATAEDAVVDFANDGTEEEDELDRNRTRAEKEESIVDAAGADSF